MPVSHGRQVSIIGEETAMSLENMGNFNNTSGVCGFTSSLYAFYNKHPGRNTIDGGVDFLANSPINFLNMVATYLKDLQQRKPKLATEIEKFTQTFENFERFSIANYVQRVKFLDREAKLTAYTFNSLSVAMTPNGVADFLQNACGLAHIRVLKPRKKVPRECIIGLIDTDKNAQAPYKRLCHWVYKRDQTIYSWGRIFAYTDYQTHPMFTDNTIGGPCYIISWQQED